MIMMSKRKVNFNDNVETFETFPDEHNDNDNQNERINDIKPNNSRTFDKKFSHTLDSDEDDDELIADSYNVLDVQQLDGQENPTINFDGEIRITPFNMEDELESGHFDREGTFIFDRDSDQLRDAWIDNIDTIPVAHELNTNRHKQETDDEIEFDLNQCYIDILALINPTETVKHAIQRFGKNCRQNQSKYKRFKKSEEKTNKSDNNVNETIDLAKQNLLNLSSLADRVLNSGDVDIYEKTYEQLQRYLNNKSDGSSTQTDDMFSDNFQETPNSDNERVESVNDNNEVLWEFKWQNTSESKIYGPYNSSQMLNWVNDGYFKDGVYVRQIDKKNSPFYNSERIDFELFV